MGIVAIDIIKSDSNIVGILTIAIIMRKNGDELHLNFEISTFQFLEMKIIIILGIDNNNKLNEMGIMSFLGRMK